MTDLILFLVGIVVGCMNAVAGGGMLVGFPVMLALGIPAITANATSNLIVLPGNAAAAFGYRKYLRKVPRAYLWLLVPTALGAIVGTSLLEQTSPARFERMIPILILFAVLLFAFQPFLHNQLHQHLHGSKRLRKQLKPLFIVGFAMFPLSIYGGFFGAGFGFIMLAFLGFTRLHDHIHRMNALKCVTTTVLSLTALLSLLDSGYIDWKHGLIMGAGGIIGSYASARSIQKVSPHVIRIIVIVIGLSAAIFLGISSL